MATEELMTWNKTNERWYKKTHGKQYCVTAGKLRKLYPDLVTGTTQSGSRKAANQWWRDKLAELAAEPKPATIIDQMIDWSVATDNNAAAEALRASKEAGIDPLKTISEAGRNIWHDRLQRAEPKPFAVSTVKEMAAEWMASKKLQVAGKQRSAGHWNNLNNDIRRFCEWFGNDRDVLDVNGGVFSRYHDYLATELLAKRISPYQATKFQGTLKAFIIRLYKLEVLATLPRNMADDDMKFALPEVEVVPWLKDDLQFVLPYCKPHFKLWLLLMANCGFTNVDIAEIEHKDVDWKNGTLTSKRSKTARSKRTPIVTFPLWKTTFDLLKQYRSNHETFVLVNDSGNQLRFERLRDEDEEKAGKYTKYDNIQSQYFDVKKLIKADHPKWKHKTLKQLRKTGPSFFRDDHRYQSIRTLFLRNASESDGKADQKQDNITDTHYAAKPSKLLAEAVRWLGDQLGIE